MAHQPHHQFQAVCHHSQTPCHHPSAVIVQNIELPQSVASTLAGAQRLPVPHHHTITLYEVLLVIAYAESYTNHPAHHPPPDPAPAHPPPPTTNTLIVEGKEDDIT